MKRPSGGTKDSSPGCSFQRERRTQGWKVGTCIVREMPADFAVLVPPGAVRLSNSSGTPDILEVKSMDPSARAEIGLPDGANTTARLSTMSTYSSLLVCLTFCFRHGIAGPLTELEAALSVAARFDDGPNDGAEVGIPT